MGHVLVDSTRTPTPPSTVLKLLVGKTCGFGCFTAVGDDDQSIYTAGAVPVDNLRRCR
jgi:superfamily I DNA/RNA helicase